MIGTQIAQKKNKHHPVTHRIRYHTAVTVCIAACCQDNGQPRIVLCSDTRLDYGDLGSTSTTVKFDVLGYGWCVQMAGDWSGVSRFKDLLKGRIQALSILVPRVKDLENEWRLATKEFVNSTFCQDNEDYQILISGFLPDGPRVFEISISARKPVVKMSESFRCIGFGSAAANTLLTLRECDASMPMNYVAYLAYEAKRASEKTGYVGRFTTLLIQAPGSDIKEKAYLKIMSDTGKAHLQAVYSGLWKIPFVQIPDFPDDFFIDPKAPQSPQ